MALRFSSGLLTGLQQYGQGGGIPADPRQRDAMQAAGVTNPLLQQFGRSLGGMFGVETRSPAAIQQAEQMAQQEQLKSSVGAIKDPSSYEGMVQLAQAVMNIDPIQGAQLLAKAEEMKKAQMAQLDQGQEEITSRLNQTRREQSLAEAVQEKNPELARLIRQGDPDAYKKGVDLLSPTGKIENKNLRFDVTEQLIDGKRVKVQIGTDQTTGKVVSENVIGDVFDDGKDYKSFLETTAGSNAYQEVNTKKREYLGKTQTLSSLIDTAQKLERERKGGIPGRVRELFVTDIAGLGDEFSIFRADLNKLRMEQALDLLPKGPASDRDVALALDASINPNDLKGEALLSYLRGMEKVNKAAQEYYSAKEEYIMQTEDANAIGFEQWSGIVGKERQLQAETSKNPAVVGEIMNLLTQAANSDSPEKQQAIFDYAREVQQELIEEGKLEADILGIVEERGRLQTLFDDIKKRKKISSFRGY
jgi:hypothetical protein